jgi:hypothetical protein
MSVGVIIGALFQVIRVIVYAIISVLAEIFLRDRLHEFSYDGTPAGSSHAHRR